jgi:hypothetical protein
MISDENLAIPYDDGGKRESWIVFAHLLDALLLLLTVEQVHIDDLTIDLVLREPLLCVPAMSTGAEGENFDGLSLFWHEVSSLVGFGRPHPFFSFSLMVKGLEVEWR